MLLGVLLGVQVSAGKVVTKEDWPLEPRHTETKLHTGMDITSRLQQRPLGVWSPGVRLKIGRIIEAAMDLSAEILTLYYLCCVSVMNNYEG